MHFGNPQAKPKTCGSLVGGFSKALRDLVTLDFVDMSHLKLKGSPQAANPFHILNRPRFWTLALQALAQVPRQNRVGGRCASVSSQAGVRVPYVYIYIYILYGGWAVRKQRANIKDLCTAATAGPWTSSDHQEFRIRHRSQVQVGNLQTFPTFHSLQKF